MNVCMYHAFKETGFTSFSYYSYFQSSVFLLSSNFSPTFYIYPSLLFALKYLSGNRFQPQNNLARFGRLSKILYLVLGSLLSLLAFYSVIPGAGTLIFSYVSRLGPFLEFKI